MKTVLFDLDGTLTDPSEGIIRSIQYSLEKMNICDYKREELTGWIGPPLIPSYQKRFGLNAEEAQRAVEYYREYFSRKGIYENRLYPDVKALLGMLKEHGCTIALATSKPEQFAVEILRYFGLTSYFDLIAGATMDEKRSEKADVIAYALSQLGEVDLLSTAMVGDRKYDILGAHANGICGIGVLYGFGEKAELDSAAADFLAPTVMSIADFVL